MRAFLPITSILQMAVASLPSPVKAQPYRIETLYEGAMDDNAAVTMRDCNEDAPLMLYASRTFETEQGTRTLGGRRSPTLMSQTLTLILFQVASSPAASRLA